MIDHSKIELSGLRLHITQAGLPDGQVVILLHGFPEFWRGWLKQIEPLAQAGYRVIIPDQRGYNLSDKPAEISEYAIEKLVSDIVGLMDELGQEKVFLVGHDWGAMVAWETALRYPEKLAKLVILNVPHPSVMKHTLLTKPDQLLKSWYIFFFQIPGLPEWLLSRGNFAALGRMLHASSNPQTFSQEDMRAYLNAWRQPNAMSGMLNWYRAIFRQTLRSLGKSSQSQPRRVHVPTLMLWGVNDVALSVEMALPSIELCNEGELILFEKATHWVQHDEAEKVTEQILRFFQTT